MVLSISVVQVGVAEGVTTLPNSAAVFVRTVNQAKINTRWKGRVCIKNEQKTSKQTDMRSGRDSVRSRQESKRSVHMRSMRCGHVHTNEHHNSIIGQENISVDHMLMRSGRESMRNRQEIFITRHESIRTGHENIGIHGHDIIRTENESMRKLHPLSGSGRHSMRIGRESIRSRQVKVTSGHESVRSRQDIMITRQMDMKTGLESMRSSGQMMNRTGHESLTRSSEPVNMNLEVQVTAMMKGLWLHPLYRHPPPVHHTVRGTAEIWNSRIINGKG